MGIAEIITVVDAVLATKPARWALLVLSALLLLTTGIGYARYKVQSLQLSAAKGDTAQYAALLLTQNAAIVKAGHDMDKLLKKAQAANREADRMREQMKKRQAELGRIILTGDCPAMVQQVIDEVRK